MTHRNLCLMYAIGQSLLQEAEGEELVSEQFQLNNVKSSFWKQSNTLCSNTSLCANSFVCFSEVRRVFLVVFYGHWACLACAKALSVYEKSSVKADFIFREHDLKTE